jgi:hypothetical protein
MRYTHPLRRGWRARSKGCRHARGVRLVTRTILAVRGCQTEIGYVDHTGCHQLVFWPQGLVTPGHQIGHMDHPPPRSMVQQQQPLPLSPTAPTWRERGGCRLPAAAAVCARSLRGTARAGCRRWRGPRRRRCSSGSRRRPPVSLTRRRRRRRRRRRGYARWRWKHQPYAAETRRRFRMVMNATTTWKQPRRKTETERLDTPPPRRETVQHTPSSYAPVHI